MELSKELHGFAKSNDSESLKKHLDNGANPLDVNIMTQTTLLHCCIENQAMDCVKLVVEKCIAFNLDLNTYDTMNGMTALGMACESGFFEIAAFLIDSGADVEQGSRKFGSPLLLASR